MCVTFLDLMYCKADAEVRHVKNNLMKYIMNSSTTY